MKVKGAQERYEVAEIMIFLNKMGGLEFSCVYEVNVAIYDLIKIRRENEMNRQRYIKLCRLGIDYLRFMILYRRREFEAPERCSIGIISLVITIQT